MTSTDRQQQNARRELLYTEVRKGICDYVNPDGTGKVVQLTPRKHTHERALTEHLDFSCV